MANLNNYIILSLDVVPALLTVIGNGIFFATLLKSPLLHTPSNLLLGVLCVTDLIVGFICQPLFIVVLIRPPGRCCSTVIKAYNLIFGLSSLNSFICGLLITLDRYSAVFHPFKYGTFVNCRRYALLTTSVFLAFAGYSTLKIPYYEHSKIAFLIVDICIEFSVIVAVLIIYGLLYRVVFVKTKADLSVGQLAGLSQHEMKRKAKDQRKTKTVAIIIGTFLACYTPLMVYYVMALLFYENISPSYPYGLALWSNFMALLNSSINPLIYCARSNDIREAALRMFKRNIVLPYHRDTGLKHSTLSMN